MQKCPGTVPELQRFDHFDGLTVETLWLTQNSALTSLSAGAFNGLTVRRELYLTLNSALKTIDASALSGLNVGNLYMGYNPLLATISAGAFNGTNVTGSLDLDVNPSLVVLSTGAFTGLTVHWTLGLSFCGLRTIDDGAFSGLTANSVILNSNDWLITIMTGAFSGLTLQELWMNFNPSLITINASALDGLSVKILRLGNSPSLSLNTLVGVFNPLTMMTEITLENSGLNLVPVGLFANLPSLTKVRMLWNPSQCIYNSSSITSVTCICATSNLNASQRLIGGDDGHCLCPAGQYAQSDACEQCPSNKYSDKPNDNRNCTACPDGHVSTIGSTNASQCRINPLWQAHKDALQAQEEDQRAKERLWLSPLSLVLLSWCSWYLEGLGCIISTKRTWSSPMAFNKQLNETLRTQVAEQHEEIAYLRDWRSVQHVAH